VRHKHKQIVAKLEWLHDALVRLTFENVSERDAFLLRWLICDTEDYEEAFVVMEGDWAPSFNDGGSWRLLRFQGYVYKHSMPEWADFDHLAPRTSRSMVVDLARGYRLQKGRRYTARYSAFHILPGELPPPPGEPAPLVESEPLTFQF
jgi:hypothetical protein